MTSRSADEDPQRFKAGMGDRAIDLLIAEGKLTLDGRSVPFSYRRLSDRHISLLIDGKSYSAVVLGEEGGVCRVQVEGHEFDVLVKNERDLLLERFGLAGAVRGGVEAIRAPMPGLVLSVGVERGQEVEAGHGLLVLEAMKMENEIRADAGGVVKSVHVSPGDAVGKNDLLIEIE